MSGRGFSEKMIQATILERFGVVRLPVRQLGLTHQALDRRIEKSARLQRALQEALRDLAAKGLIEAVRGRDRWAIRFVSKHLGKHRRYGERTDPG